MSSFFHSIYSYILHCGMSTRQASFSFSSLKLITKKTCSLSWQQEAAMHSTLKSYMRFFLKYIFTWPVCHTSPSITGHEGNNILECAQEHKYVKQEYNIIPQFPSFFHYNLAVSWSCFSPTLEATVYLKYPASKQTYCKHGFCAYEYIALYIWIKMHAMLQSGLKYMFLFKLKP